MEILSQLNSWPLYLISGVIILFVMAMSVFFMVRAWKAGITVGMDKTKLRRAVTSSITFTLLPSVSILLASLLCPALWASPFPGCV